MLDIESKLEHAIRRAGYAPDSQIMLDALATIRDLRRQLLAAQTLLAATVKEEGDE